MDCKRCLQIFANLELESQNQALNASPSCAAATFLFDKPEHGFGILPTASLLDAASRLLSASLQQRRRGRPLLARRRLRGCIASRTAGNNKGIPEIRNEQKVELHGAKVHMAKRMREMSKPVVPLLVLRGIERSQSWVPGNIHFGQVQGVLRIEACTMVPCMEAVEDVVALRSKLLQGGRAAASAPGGAVAHEAGEHASIVVDNKLTSGESECLRASRRSVCTTRHQHKPTHGRLYRRPKQRSGRHRSGEHPELAEASPGRRCRSHARQASTPGARPASGRKKHWQGSDDTAQSRFDRRHSCSQQGMCGK